MEKKKYYVLKNKNMAITISFLLNKPFYTFDDRFNEGKKVYSFEDDDKFREILTLVSKIRTENSNY
ncbi:hypothetical protein J2Z53_001369 [Clostridium moniliforme]|uniref:DUF5659 domain-containing protein n=1 Tax=Clostridium moniliforme TaxID=39489 RepID=A0ABS4F0L7_9CLOT|nr:hypothetical protein [Clostridium moniliforme]MBP1889786.1 hypothetical protein [Clostridium moniliforme]